MTEDKNWAVIKHTYKHTYGGLDGDLHAVIHKPTFGFKVPKEQIVFDNLTREEAIALLKLIGE